MNFIRSSKTEIGDFVRVKFFGGGIIHSEILDVVKKHEGQIGMICGVSVMLGKCEQRIYDIRFFDEDCYTMQRCSEDFVESVTWQDCCSLSLLYIGQNIILQHNYESDTGFLLCPGVRGFIVSVDWKYRFLIAQFPFLKGKESVKLSFTDAFRVASRKIIKCKDFVVVRDANCSELYGEYGVVLCTAEDGTALVSLFNKGFSRWFSLKVLSVVSILAVVKSIKISWGQVIRVNSRVAEMFCVPRVGGFFGENCKVICEGIQAGKIIVQMLDGSKRGETFILPWYVFNYSTGDDKCVREQCVRRKGCESTNVSFWEPQVGQDVLVRENEDSVWVKAKLLDFQTVVIAVTDQGVFPYVMPLESHEKYQGFNNVLADTVKVNVVVN